MPELPGIKSDRYYTVDEVAAWFRVDVRTVYRWIRLGMIEALSVGAPDSIEVLTARIADLKRRITFLERRIAELRKKGASAGTNPGIRRITGASIIQAVKWSKLQRKISQQSPQPSRRAGGRRTMQRRPGAGAPQPKVSGSEKSKAAPSGRPRPR